MDLNLLKLLIQTLYLGNDHQSKGKTKKNQVHAVHPAQEDKVRCHR